MRGMEMELQNHVIVRPGDMFYIPAGMPHLAANLGTEPVVQVIARTHPNEREKRCAAPRLRMFRAYIVTLLAVCRYRR